MRIPSNYLLVEVESTMNDKIETESGVTLYRPLDLGEREWYNKTKGKVVATPEKLTDLPTKSVIDKNTVRTHKDMFLTYNVGDVVYFNYLSLQPDKQIYPDGDATKLQFLIPYDNIHYGVRDGSIICNTGRVIIQPMEEESVKTQKLIIPPTMKKKSMTMGEIIAIGRPWKDMRIQPIQIGDIIVYNKREGDWIGKENEWLSIYQEHIYLKI